MNLPYPLGNETADVAGDIQRLAEAVDTAAAKDTDLTAHITAAAPHSGHETPAGAQAKVDAAINNHTGGADPHPQYETSAEAQAKVDNHANEHIRHSSYAVATGSANAYAVTLSPAPAAYVEGMAVIVKINVDNTGASTINVNGLGAKTIKKPNGSDVAAGNLKAGSVYTLRYNGTNFILQGSDSAGNATPADVLAGKTFSNDSGPGQIGTMPNKVGSATVITPGTADQAIPEGYYGGALGDGKVLGDANLVSGNIKSGVNIFGVAGSFTAKRYAIGTVQHKYPLSAEGQTGHGFQIRGLAFTPKFVLVSPPNGYSYPYRVFLYDVTPYTTVIRTHYSGSNNYYVYRTEYADGIDLVATLGDNTYDNYWNFIALE